MKYIDQFLFTALSVFFSSLNCYQSSFSSLFILCLWGVSASHTQVTQRDRQMRMQESEKEIERKEYNCIITTLCCKITADSNFFTLETVLWQVTSHSEFYQDETFKSLLFSSEHHQHSQKTDRTDHKETFFHYDFIKFWSASQTEKFITHNLNLCIQWAKTEFDLILLCFRC